MKLLAIPRCGGKAGLRQLILGLAGDAESIREQLNQALERLPFAMDAHFHRDEPAFIPPDAISRDFLELALNAQQEALLKLDLALDRLG